MAEIKLEHVSYEYGAGTPFAKMALEDVSVTFTPGVITGVIGHTGSGKSTLAQMLNGILRPSSGRVLLDGEEFFSDSKGKKNKKQKQMQIKNRFRVGLVFQYPEYQLFEESVYRDLAYGPKNMGKSEEEIRRLVEEAAYFTGVEREWMEKSPFELSGGQKRRVAIAGVLAMDPEVLVLDEPAAGLDPGGREEILGRLKTYQREKKKTVILISHSMEDVARYADELLVLKDSRVFLHGSVSEIFSDAEKLEEAHLSLPQITRLMLRLRQEGIGLPDSVYTVSDALFALKDLLKGENGVC
ncbi:MAG: energy-coupling factor transporter ATPase [Clostridia bacterium]|nr:energy-coupling factor transporter ATPase [Clostridia bacterium]